MQDGRRAEIQLNLKWPDSILGRSIDLIRKINKKVAVEQKAEATKVWEEARHAQMAVIGNMKHVYSEISTVWLGLTAVSFESSH